MKYKLVVIFTLLVLGFTPHNVKAVPDEPIPPEDDVPWGVWYVKEVYTNKSPVQAMLCYPSNSDCQYAIIAQCIETGDPIPRVGDPYGREGSRQWYPIDRKAQTLLWLETIRKPSYRYYLPFLWLRKCTCDCSCYCW